MKTMEKTYDVAIIGAGPAAFTAAIYTARAALQTVVITGDIPGGQLLLTSEVENYPGFSKGILGPDLMEEMRAQAERFGVAMISKIAKNIKITESLQIGLAESGSLLAKSIIVATGAQAKWLGLKNEQRLMGKGISACATCDGYFFQNKRVVVVGGGDSALEEALTLSKFASLVIVVHRRDQLRASKIMQERAQSNPKIEFVWNSQVSDVLGDDMVSGVEIVDIKTQKTKKIDCEGLFVAIGHKPASEFLKDVIELDEKGYVVVRDNVFTSQDGIFAAGDVVDSRYRQAITAAGDGCRAALEVEKYLMNVGMVKS